MNFQRLLLGANFPSTSTIQPTRRVYRKLSELLPRLFLQRAVMAHSGELRMSNAAQKHHLTISRIAADRPFPPDKLCRAYHGIIPFNRIRLQAVIVAPSQAGEPCCGGG